MNILHRLIARLLGTNHRAAGSDGAEAVQIDTIQTLILPFQHSPFPYHQDPNITPPFFDVLENGKRGHRSARGGIYWEDKTYSDNRVLISIPKHFTLEKPVYIVLYLHGNQSTLGRDVRDRQQIPAQVAQSGLNAILVAPQLAKDALDSSAGNFANTDFLTTFLQELAEQVGNWQNDTRYTKQLKQADVILVAYSGGYLPAAYALNGNAAQRIHGVILLDAVYGNEDTFSQFIREHCHHSFFFSCFTAGASDSNHRIQKQLTDAGHKFETGLPGVLADRTVSFFALNDKIDHRQLLNQAWIENPLADLLARIQSSR